MSAAMSDDSPNELNPSEPAIVIPDPSVPAPSIPAPSIPDAPGQDIFEPDNELHAHALTNEDGHAAEQPFISGAHPGLQPAWPQPAYQPELFSYSVPPRLYPRRTPNLGNAILFFVLALVLVILGQVLAVILLQLAHVFPHHSFQSLFVLSSEDARISIPIQAFSYGLIALIAIPVFSVLWEKPFGEGVHWNTQVAQSRFLRLALLGLAAGFGITLLGSILPMPKTAPITQDMMKSAVGAWIMLVFGITVAPLLEELAFRGFLLPGLINFFRWLNDRGAIPEEAVKWFGIPFSILITSLGFAFMHSPQVSHAWGPLALIGAVSIVLCIVRLTMNSVAAGVIVHAAYNFTLFAGVLYQTSGFRHLERLTN